MRIETDIQNANAAPQQEVKTTPLDATVSEPAVNPIMTSEQPREKTWRDNLNIIIAVIGLLIIAFQAWIMYRQTAIMTKQTAIMDQTFRVGERAYVGIASLSPKWQAGEVEITLQNIGQVPAKAIKVEAQEIRGTPSGSDTVTGSRIYDRLDGSTFGWGAGDVQLFPGTPMRVAIPLRGFKPEEIDAINKKQEVLYIGGNIEYEDGFGRVDTTVFAFEYNPPPSDGWTAHSDLSRFFKR
jgi:hypothetical protein